jgi:hypothetical protein
VFLFSSSDEIDGASYSYEMLLLQSFVILRSQYKNRLAPTTMVEERYEREGERCKLYKREIDENIN